MKLVAYKGRGKHPWRWRLVARNGKIIGDGAEGYATKGNLRRAISLLRRSTHAVGWIIDEQ